MVCNLTPCRPSAIYATLVTIVAALEVMSLCNAIAGLLEQIPFQFKSLAVLL